MSSNLYVLDGSLYQHSNSDLLSSQSDLLFADQFSPFSDTTIDILQALSDHPTQQNPVEESQSVDHISPSLLSSSPPSHQLENLSLCQTTQLQPLTSSPNSVNGFGNLSFLDAFQVKTEECHLGFENSYGSQAFAPRSYSCSENVATMMQSCATSNYFNGKSDFLAHSQPGFDILTESQSFQNQALSSPEYRFFSGQMRRVSSTGDLQNFRATCTTQRSLSSSLVSGSSFVDETNFKVGKYSAEERKERISKYRAKRTHRNFSKTIKYACRKTLADNRPRIRGRFARNDETGEIPKAPSSTRDEDEDDYELLMGGVHEEEENNGTVLRGQLVNRSICPTQFQYYGF